jgi:hypothetical protein
MCLSSRWGFQGDVTGNIDRFSALYEPQHVRRVIDALHLSTVCGVNRCHQNVAQATNAHEV